VIATVAAGHVDWHYLALLLVPSLVVILVMGLTWWSRSRSRRGGPGAPSGRGGRSGTAPRGGRSGGARQGGRSRAPRGGVKRRRR
jgi:hypothetical protein